ncbi:MAG: valine--tRNA ligase [Terracidiphilus sp.]|jgi:valyl-tRNA synthetase
MPHDLPKAYDPTAIEDHWAGYWVRENLFVQPTPGTPATPVQNQSLDGKSPGCQSAFTILLPPPNVTGRLHMGHMLNQTEMDILTRWRRMSGRRALWVPGTDHAGIATQMMVERQLASEGSSRQKLGREAFVERVWQWRRHYGGAILEQMKRLGVSVDWSREYFTMDEPRSLAVREAFVRLYHQGLIYRGAYIVNWCPRCQTAISDLEVVHQEQKGHLWEIRYPVLDANGKDSGEFLTVATTRPETMLGDTAVAIHPEDERYLHLHGKKLRLPLPTRESPREIPIVLDSWVSRDFGTGAVKVTPAHDPNDFALAERHHLPSVNVMDDRAHINAEGGAYAGLDRFAARKKIIQDLEARSALAAVKDYTNNVGHCDRCKTVIEPRLSTQWFIAVNKKPDNGSASMAELAIAAVKPDANGNKAICFTPENYEKIYLEWMTNIHDWCISRQLWWGHRIPAWHCAVCHKITVPQPNSKADPTACAHCGSNQITQETDVLDTWFSSGLLPVSVFGWPNIQTPPCHPERRSSAGADDRVEGSAVVSSGGRDGGPDSQAAAYRADAALSRADFDAFYPTSLLVTGFDILFFWVARMIMLGCWFAGDVPVKEADGSLRPRTLAESVPFKEVYIHALVRDANREKMSKTKGNVIDPIEIVKQYGTDAVRFTLASMASPGTDIAFNVARTEGYRAFANKIWNAARFIFMNVDRAAEIGIKVDPAVLGSMPTVAADAPLEARWIVAELHSTALLVNQALESYRFDDAANLIYQFFWGNFCDWYLEIVKLRLDFSETGDQAATKAALTTLVQVFECALRLLSPFMPFLTEELWHAVHGGDLPAKSIALTRFPQGEKAGIDRHTLNQMTYLADLIVETRSYRKDREVPENESVELYVVGLGGYGRAGYPRESADDLIAQNEAVIKRLAKVSKITETLLDDPNYEHLSWRPTRLTDIAITYEKPIDLPAERERLTKDIARYEKGLAAAERQLGNEGFLAKAPAHVVEGLKKQEAETRLLLEKARAAFAALPKG